MIKLFVYTILLYSPLGAFSQLTETSLLQLARIPSAIHVVPSKTAVITWKNHLDLRSGYFVVERKNDAGDFVMIASLKVSGHLPKYEITDQSPLPGTNHYRVKHLDQAGAVLYSPVMAADLGSGEFSRFYPNPADNAVIVQSQCPVDIKIYSNGGNLTISKLLEKGISALDVSSLSKGIYVLMITNVETRNSIRQILYKN